jgi:hypothetical protein
VSEPRHTKISHFQNRVYMPWIFGIGVVSKENYYLVSEVLCVASSHRPPFTKYQVEGRHTIEWFDVRMNKNVGRVVDSARVKVFELAIFHSLSHQRHGMECLPEKLLRKISPVDRQGQLSSRDELMTYTPPSFVSLR